MCAGSDVMKLRRSARHTRESYSVVTQATVSRYVIVILLLGNMTLLHTLPQVTQKYAAMRFRYFKYFINFFRMLLQKLSGLLFWPTLYCVVNYVPILQYLLCVYYNN